MTIQDSLIHDSLKVKRPLGQDSLVVIDTTQKAAPKRDIETTVEYSAEDSIIVNAQERTAFLYKDAKVTYGKRKITANTIDMDYKVNMVTAIVGKDTLGNKVGVPIFEEGSDKYEAQQIKFNFKTKKGQVKSILTKQGQGIVHGEVVKKLPDNTMYVEHAMYTTCDLREPHFCIKSSRLKLVAGKKIVTKAFNMQLDDIPTILAFPFGIFPMTKKRSSGIIIPSYVDNATRGFGLIGGGFYWAVNKYIGATMTTNVYTNGGQEFNLKGDYKSRYAFQGTINLSYADVYLTKDNPSNQGHSQSTWVKWSHNPLTKGTGRFAASVNMGSSKYNQNTQYDAAVLNTGSFQSNVSYSNAIKKTPFTYGVNFRQSQDVKSGRMDLTLPDASLTMRTIYPLRNIPIINKLDPIKKFGFKYTSAFTNIMTNFAQAYNPGFPVNGTITPPERSTYIGPSADSDYTTALNNYYANDTTGNGKRNSIDTLSFKRFFNSFGNNTKWTAVHTVPFSTSIKLLKYFSLNPSFNLTDTWYDRKYNFTDWNATTRTVGVEKESNFNGGLKEVHKYNFSVGITTNVYGTFHIKKFNIEAIRHTMRPTISYTYTPDFTSQGEYQKVKINAGYDPNLDYKNINVYTGAAGTPSVESQIASFSVNNQFEMKMRDIKDTAKISYKKIMLLDNLNFAGGYNFKADSFNLSNIAVTARTRILMFDINFGSQFDPYYYHSTTTTGDGSVYRRRTSYYDWGSTSKINSHDKGLDSTFGSHPFGIGKFISSNVSISASFKPKQGKKLRSISPVADGTDYYFMAIRNMAPYVDWNTPWGLSVSYILTFNRYTAGPNGLVIDKTDFRNNLSFNGNISLTPKWKLSGSVSYDFKTNSVVTPRITITRDLHCWQASFQYGVNNSSGINTGDFFIATIGIKASTLKDLKLDRRGNPVQ